MIGNILYFSGMMAPSFDNWTIVFLLFSFLGFFTSILIQFQSQRNRIGRLLISMLLVLFSATLVEYVLYWTRYQIYFPHTVNLSSTFFFLYGPLVYTFCNNSENIQFKKKDLNHFLVFLLMLMICVPFYFQSAANKRQIIFHGFDKNSWYPFIFNNMIWLSILHLYLYGYLVFKKRAAFKEFKLINNWIQLLALGLLGMASALLTYMLLVKFNLLRLEWDYTIGFSMVLFIVLITVTCFLKPQVFNDFLPQVQEIISVGSYKYKNSPLNASMRKEIATNLNDLMIKESLWQKNDLRLDELSYRMQMPKQYISQVINEEFHKNFFDFINSYRVEEAKKLIQENQFKTLIEIAYHVGFNNKVSFGKAFKSYTQLTPAEYRNRLKETT
jgi:AraC-like DNA-binding protein